MVASSVTATSAISAAGSPLAIEPPMVPRWRVGGWPTHGSALASSGSLRRDDSDRARRRTVASPRQCVTPSASSRMNARSGNAGDVDEPRRPRQPHRQHGDQRLPAGDDARAVVGGQQPARLARRSRAAHSRRQPASCRAIRASASRMRGHYGVRAPLHQRNVRPARPRGPCAVPALIALSFTATRIEGQGREQAHAHSQSLRRCQRRDAFSRHRGEVGRGAGVQQVLRAAAGHRHHLPRDLRPTTTSTGTPPRAASTSSTSTAA